MKDATLPTRKPRTWAEIEPEMDRMLGELQLMLKNIERSNAEAARLSAKADINIQWLEEHLHVASASSSNLTRSVVVEKSYVDQLHAQEITALKQHFADELEKMELRLRLEMAERRLQLPPKDEAK